MNTVYCRPGDPKTLPYYFQWANLFEPQGTCNVCSLAVALDVAGVPEKIDGYHRPDELYLDLQDQGGSRHNHQDLHNLLRSYVGDRAYYTQTATEATIRELVSHGCAVVIAGWFTTFGHIVTIVGYDDDGYIVQDSNGEWFSWGYVKRPRPLLHYSRNLIKRLCWDAAWGQDRDRDGETDHGYLIHAILPEVSALTKRHLIATEGHQEPKEETDKPLAPGVASIAV